MNHGHVKWIEQGRFLVEGFFTVISGFRINREFVDGRIN